VEEENLGLISTVGGGGDFFDFSTWETTLLRRRMISPRVLRYVSAPADSFPASRYSEVVFAPVHVEQEAVPTAALSLSPAPPPPPPPPAEEEEDASAAALAAAVVMAAAAASVSASSASAVEIHR
jgi:hypothetical protein